MAASTQKPGSSKPKEPSKKGEALRHVLELEDEDDEPSTSWKINTDYAKKYDDWRAKEEMQKLKNKYGDDPGVSSSSSSESEDEDAEGLTPQVEKDFFKTLSLLKSKNPRIYNKSEKFFEDLDPAPTPSSSEPTAKSKPMFLRDYERKVVLEEGGVVDEEKGPRPPKFQSHYDQEQEDLKKGLSALARDDSDNEDLLVKREKTAPQLKAEEDDYFAWLKGNGGLKGDSAAKETMKPLKEFWNDSALDDGEKFLRDYILDRKYVDKDVDRIPTYSELVGDDHSSEEEVEIEKAEEFEQKYNFRFEEPDPEFIKRYPRTMDESLRRKDETRKQKRDEVKERKEAEKQRVREEIKQLKSLKHREIKQKIEKLKAISGQADMPFRENDLEGDFDPDQYDSAMSRMFNETYYGNCANPEKPDLSDESDMDENWINDQLDDYEDPEDDHSADRPVTSTNAPQSSKRKRRTRVSELVQNTKPVFDPNEKKLEEYLDEYYKLDCEDVVNGQPCRFKYRTVVPNSFGLSADEILLAPDRELNAWCSLKKAVQHRPQEEELYDVRAYQQKASLQDLKMKILPTLARNEEEQIEAQESQTVKKKRRKRKKKQPGDEPAPVNSADDTDAVTGREGQLQNSAEVADQVDQVDDGQPDNLEHVADEENGETDAKPLDESVKRRRRRNKKKHRDGSEAAVEQSTELLAEPAKKKQKSSNRREVLPMKLPSAKISDERLKAYGLNPKKFRQKEKYVLLAKAKGTKM